MSTFSLDTAVTPVPDRPGTFRAELSSRWWILRGPNGGYLAAIVTRAMQAAVDDPARTPRSLTLHYLEAAAEGPVTVEVRTERTGRSLSTLSARMVQDGRPVVLAIAAFATGRTTLEFNDLAMPDVKPASAIEPRPYEPTTMARMSERMDVRQVIGPLPFAGKGGAATGGWLRLAQPEALDHPQLALLTDAWIPAVFNRATGPLGAPTVDLTIHFREPIPADADPDAHYLALFRTSVGAAGFVEEDGEIWTADGRLLAQSRQLALALPMG